MLQAVPVPGYGAPEEGTPAHRASKAAPGRYWADYGFREAAGGYLVLGEMADAFDDLMTGIAAHKGY